MIPTKDKNLLLLPLIDGGITQPFNMPGHPGYDKNKDNHNGLDIGWTKGHQYTNILACQDGTVMETFNNNSSMGNGICLQHDYADGTHRWTCYIHLRENVGTKFKKGDKVKMGDVIGVRGGSPYINGKAKYGVHLHLYVTKPVTAKYTWNTVKANVIDPLPLLYRSKKLKYDVLVGKLAELPYIEDAIINVVDPVDKNELVNQLMEKSSNLRVRMAPNLKGTIIGYLKPNVYYNWYEISKADDYDWYKIADNQWAAKTSTMIIFPAKTELDLVKEELAQLKDDYLGLENRFKAIDELNTELRASNDVLSGKIVRIKDVVEE